MSLAALASFVTVACGGQSHRAGPEAPGPAEGSAAEPSLATFSHPGAIIADSGFRPPGNGFPFENYGATLNDGATPSNMTVDDLRAMFGDGVCADLAAGRCDLLPEAAAWLRETNAGMGAGHCYGFAVAAELFWQGQRQVREYGGPAPPALQIASNDVLQRRLAYDWALQLLDSVRSEEITGTPNKILSHLIKVLRPGYPETYTIAFFKRDWSGGHAVTPYAVKSLGAGKFAILIYDNNWPGATRAIEVDSKRNTWKYDAAINPDNPAELYEGTAGSKTLSLFPTSPGLGVQPCPFCGKRSRRPSVSGTAAGAAARRTEITLVTAPTDHATVVINDEHGHRLGLVGGKLVNEIPGARVEEVFANTDWAARLEPRYVVPADRRYRITSDARSVRAPGTQSIDVIGPEWDVTVEGLGVQRGDVDTLIVDPEAAQVSLTTSRPKPRRLEIGVNDDAADHDFVLDSEGRDIAGTTNVTIPVGSADVGLASSSARGSAFDLEMTRLTLQGSERFRHRDVTLASDDRLVLHVGAWAGGRSALSATIRNHTSTATRLLENDGG